ncbi:hypothetical protein AKJ40_04135 [candidate division MSBL1 archaeon SCGC-AAA259M10]|uniref:Haloacid dehalogenase n=4 Tax=candidate division MSBL1 TaxID=215777 RepID=A0A133UXW3_9EURY|nr:hypothetical protein AKJ40_04135 [candidate division MSBL1 archaeon SCGC-AAA259M10]
MVSIDIRDKRRNIEAVIFDMDNTFFDFIQAKIIACEKVTERIGRNDGQELLNYFLRDDVNFEDVECIADYLKDRDSYDEEIFQECCKIYEDIKLNTIELYDGVEETLEDLKNMGLKLAVVSNAGKEHVKSRLNKTGLTRFFETVVSRDETKKAKPDPEPILSALNVLGVSPKKALMVGDSIQRDIKPGEKLGMVTAYAQYGDRNSESEEHVEPDIRLSNIKKLNSLLQ